MAHELVRRGFAVSVYELDPIPGGFFRSARMPDRGNLPSEYSWHGMGPWYHNAFDVMKQIPFDETGSVYDKSLSRPIDFGIFPDHGPAEFYDRGLRSIPRMFGLSGWEMVKATWLMLKTWASNKRTEQRYARLNAAEQWRSLLRDRGYRRWRSSFGPWIGSDWTKVSLHTAGQFFRKQLITKPTHLHPADEEGPAWTQGARDGWLLMRGPSSEFWFEKWVRDLEARGVKFYWESPLQQLLFNGTSITSAVLNSGEEIRADFYALATTPFAAADILARTPELEKQDELRLFRPLVQDGPHTQVSFRIGFAEPINFPRARAAAVVADSEFNLTLFAQEQVWKNEVYLGYRICSLWTGTSCTGAVPGRIYQLPVAKCTKAQFMEEVKAQILSCESLDALIREANNGRSLRDFEMSVLEVWHEWTFSPEGIRPHQPKWVTTTNTQPYQPRQQTPVPNLVLAGSHTRTAADVWSIEGAVESGRRAAQVVDDSVYVLPQYQPLWLRTLGAMDDVCFALGLPHVLELLPIVIVAAIVAAVLVAL